MNTELRIINNEVDHVAEDNAIAIPANSSDNMRETVYLLKSPANAEHLSRSIEQYKTGQIVRKNQMLSHPKE